MTDVLVVEGQTLVRRMAVEALRDAGLRVAEADCAEAALRAVDAAPERPPDVLVTAVTRFESALLSHFRSDHAEILGKIRETKTLDDDTAAQLKTIIGEFARTFA